MHSQAAWKSDSKHVHQSIKHSEAESCGMRDTQTLSHSSQKQSKVLCKPSQACTCADSKNREMEQTLLLKHTKFLHHQPEAGFSCWRSHLCTSPWHFHKLEWSPAPLRWGAGRSARTWPCCLCLLQASSVLSPLVRIVSDSLCCPQSALSAVCEPSKASNFVP